jgi:hypothetical protein
MNACEDFLHLLLNSHVITAAMTMLGKENLEDIPSSMPEDLWLYDEIECQEELDKFLFKLVERHVDIKCNYPSRLSIISNDRVFQYSK